MHENRRIVPYFFVAAMVAAPFLALLYGVTLGLGVLAVGLAATTFLALDAAKSAEPGLRQRLQVLAFVNGALTVAGIGILLVRLLS